MYAWAKYLIGVVVFVVAHIVFHSFCVFSLLHPVMNRIKYNKNDWNGSNDEGHNQNHSINVEKCQTKLNKGQEN